MLERSCEPAPTLVPRPSTTGPSRRTPAADLDVAADPGGTVELGVGGQLRAARRQHPRGQLAGVERQPQLARERVEGPLAQLRQRADVVPVVVDLVHVEGDVVLEQGREHVLGPVHEVARTGSSRRSPARRCRSRSCPAARAPPRGRLLLEAGDAPVAVVQHDAVLARVGTSLTASVAIPPAARWRAAKAPRSMSVSASPLITRKASSPKNSAQARTPPAVPSSSGSWW